MLKASLATVCLAFLLGSSVAAANNNPNPLLTVHASAAPPVKGQPFVRGMVFAQSATDTSVPFVMVAITTCRNGQQTPFNYKLGRPLGPHEAVTSIEGGRVLIWSMAAAPGNTDVNGPARLPIQFNLDQNKGGPTFCARVFGWTRTTSTTPTKVSKLVWQLS